MAVLTVASITTSSSGRNGLLCQFNPARMRELDVVQHRHGGKRAVHTQSDHRHATFCVLVITSGSVRATRHLRIRAHGAPGRSQGRPDNNASSQPIR